LAKAATSYLTLVKWVGQQMTCALVSMFLLTSCFDTQKTVYAPVSELTWQRSIHYQLPKRSVMLSKSLTWQKPTSGRVIKNYSSNHKGINIQGPLANPIYAAADGYVVYSGNGIRGLGNMIIIKHNQLYLSAYAYNQSNLVTEGQFVKRGQKIATMGLNKNRKILLHFEVRRNGKPINPLTLINVN
jgi:murein DD-endopeptidase MepM/ murein hydrolase activator NlpD